MAKVSALLGAFVGVLILTLLLSFASSAPLEEDVVTREKELPPHQWSPQPPSRGRRISNLIPAPDGTRLFYVFDLVPVLVPPAGGGGGVARTSAKGDALLGKAKKETLGKPATGRPVTSTPVDESRAEDGRVEQGEFLAVSSQGELTREED